MSNALNKVLLLTIIICIQACSSFQNMNASEVDNLLNQAEKNIIMSYSVENMTVRDELLNDALDEIQKAENICKSSELPVPVKVYSLTAFYYLTIGNYIQTKNFNSQALSLDPGHPYSKIIETRLIMKEKGRSGASDSMSIIQSLDPQTTQTPFARITMGDICFMSGKYADARVYYYDVLKLNNGFQVDAADRVETINQIESLRINTELMRDIIFSKGIKRDEIAFIMDRVIFINMPSKKADHVREYPDLNSSMYADSIKKMTDAGMFSYISDSMFEPFTIITRRELAKIVEDYIVLKSGNTGYRSKYREDRVSPFNDVKSNDVFFNAIAIAEEQKIMDASLGGSFEPLKTVSGLEALITIKRMTGSGR